MGENTDSEALITSLTSIIRGASIFAIGKGMSNLLKFAINFVLTHGLGPSLYGVYVFADTFLFLVGILGRLGTGESLLRFIPEHDDIEKRRSILGLAYLTVLAGSIIVASLLYIAAPLITEFTLENPLLNDVLRILAIVLPFHTLSNVTNNVFRALELIEYRIFLENVVRPVLRLIFVSIALLIGYSLFGVVAAVAVATLLVFGLSVYLLMTRTALSPSLAHYRDHTSEFYKYSLPLTFKDIGWFLYYRVDILMIGFLMADSSVGIYKVAVVVASLLTLPLSAFNQLFPPVASRLYSKGEQAELESIYATLTRWTFTIALMPAMAVVVYNQEILRIFGEGFDAGATVLTIVIIGQLTNCAVGPSGFLLMMTDHQYLNMANQWIFGVINIVLNYLLIQEFGILGAGLATASVLASINVVRVLEVWYTEGLIPYSKIYWKPALAGLFAAGVMRLFQIPLSGNILLVTGSISGAIVFIILLFLFGINYEDIEFFNQVINS